MAPPPAIVKFGSEAFSFIEVSDSGVAQTITIQISTGDAIYSRGDIFGGKLLLVQSKGNCEQK